MGLMYYDINEKMILTEISLERRGLCFDTAALSKIGIYPLKGDSPQCDKRFYQPIPKEPVLEDGNYVLHYELVPVPLEQAQAIKLAEIKSAFTSAQAKGCALSSLGFKVDATRTSIGDIEGLITLVESGTLVEPVRFRDYDNDYHNLALDQLKTVRVEAMGRGPLVYAHKWNLETAVNTATTVEAVQDINTTTGWPE